MEGERFCHLTRFGERQRGKHADDKYGEELHDGAGSSEEMRCQESTRIYSIWGAEFEHTVLL